MLLNCVFENRAVECSCPNHLFLGLILLLANSTIVNLL